MNATYRDVLIGVFVDRGNAQQAIAELKRVGFRDEQIGVASREADRDEVAKGKSTGTHAGEGAAAGVATGAGVGGLWALGIAAGVLPAIGPVIAGGLLASILASAATGAAAGGLAGAMIGMGIPEEEATYYESEFKAGRTVVSVRPEGRAAEAWEILQRFGATDSSSRAGYSTTSHQTRSV